MKTVKHIPPTKQQAPSLVKAGLKWLFWGLIVYLPLHVFISQSASLVTGGLDIWKVAKDGVIILGAIGAAYLLLPKLRGNPDLKKIAFVSLLYALLHSFFVLFVDLDTSTSILGSAYNLRPLMLSGIGLAVGVAYRDFIQATTQKIILGISGFVATLGIIQYFLPSDWLLRFGYGIERGAKEAFLIDDKEGFIRVMSTLRDPNSLGAFLIVTSALTLAIGLTAKGKTFRRLSYLLAVQLGAVALTFSRSSWLGLAVAFTVVLASSGRFRRYFSLKNITLGLVSIVAIFLIALPVVGDSSAVRNVFFHGEEILETTDSNKKHISSITRSLTKIGEQPIGHGPGTAGNVSLRNPRGTVVTENYYLQIAHEVGVLGLAIFLYLNFLVYRLLLKTATSPLRTALIASFWGLVVTNMLLHTWSNEAVAMVWWMMAGYQIGLSSAFRK